MYYFAVLGIFFALIPLIIFGLGSSVGELNFILWKNSSERSKKELNGLWSKIFIGYVRDPNMIYEENKSVYKISFQLMLAVYIITLINTLIIIAGFVVVGFFDNLGLLLLIVCAVFCCISYLILYIIIVCNKSQAYKNK